MLPLHGWHPCVLPLGASAAIVDGVSKKGVALLRGVPKVFFVSFTVPLLCYFPAGGSVTTGTGSRLRGVNVRVPFVCPPYYVLARSNSIGHICGGHPLRVVVFS